MTQPDNPHETPASNGADSNPYAAPTADTAPLGDDEMLASRGQRLAAVLIDGLVQMAVVVPLMWVSGTLTEVIESDGQYGLGTTVRWFLIGELVFLLVQGWLLFTRQQTVGKMLLNMRIVGINETRVPPGRLYGIRYLLMHVLWQVPLLGLVDGLMIFRRDRRCLHDLMAGTRVVEAPAGS